MRQGTKNSIYLGLGISVTLSVMTLCGLNNYNREVYNSNKLNSVDTVSTNLDNDSICDRIITSYKLKPGKDIYSKKAIDTKIDTLYGLETSKGKIYIPKEYFKFE